MFNLSIGCSPIQKSNSTAVNTNLLRCKTRKSDENLNSVKFYSSAGSQTPIQKSVKKQVNSVRKQDTDLWSGLMGGLFN